jgi:hypothetical protein
MTSDDRWEDTTTFDEAIDRLLMGAPPAPEAPAWCSDVAVLVRTAQRPALPDELAGEADIVARMRELLTVPAAAGDEPTSGADAVDADAAPAGGADVVELDLRTPAPERLTGRLLSRREPSDLDGYRAKHGERHYTAKHVAARLEASGHPVARTVGRVVAMKAAAVGTAALISVAAAAAATTGIVATVVVPAFDHDRHPVTPAETPAGDKDDAGTSRSGSRPSGEDDGDDMPAPTTCSNVLMTCPPGVVQVPASPATSTPAASSTATSAPTTTPTTSPTSTTTSTTAPETPPSTPVDPTTSTTPPTTVEDPGTLSAPAP